MVAAFYDEDLTRAMTADGENRFYMIVPDGGGVLLSAVLQRPMPVRIVKPQSVRPNYTATCQEAENYDTWIPVP